MYNLAPVGKYFVQVCTTSPCLLRGANKIVDICKKRISEKKVKFQTMENVPGLKSSV